MDHEWKTRTTYGDLGGVNLLDWPIDSADLAPWYDKAEIAMGSTHRHRRPPLPANNNYEFFRGRCQADRIEALRNRPYATNAEPFDGRSASVQDGFNRTVASSAATTWRPSRSV